MAVEGRYTNFGDYISEDNIGLGFKITAEYSAYTVHAVGIYPFGQSGFDIYGQLGAGLVNYEAKENFFGQSEDSDGGTWTAGVGVRYTPPSFQYLTVQLAYDIYAFEAEEDFTGETFNQSLGMGKLGIQYNF